LQLLVDGMDENATRKVTGGASKRGSSSLNDAHHEVKSGSAEAEIVMEHKVRGDEYKK